jgi:hypothetical protein
VSAPAPVPCRSNRHLEEPGGAVASVVVGTFDASLLNGEDPEPYSHYCLRCAVLLVDAGLFTPDPDQTPVPSVGEYLRASGLVLET